MLITVQLITLSNWEVIINLMKIFRVIVTLDYNFQINDNIVEIIRNAHAVIVNTFQMQTVI